MFYYVLMAVYVNAGGISNPVQVTVMVFQSISWRRSEVCSFTTKAVKMGFKKTGEPSRWAGFSRHFHLTILYNFACMYSYNFGGPFGPMNRTGVEHTTLT